VTKSPKLYFYDTGLACSLLGIESAAQIDTHYLRGGLFESFIIAEISKHLYNTGRRPRIYFWQEAGRNEIDCIIEKAQELIAVEIKASKTISKNFFTVLHSWNELSQSTASNNFIVYAGLENEQWPGGMVVSWQKMSEMLDKQFEKLIP